MSGLKPVDHTQPSHQKQGGEVILSCRPVLQVCEECREEFCSGSCIIFQYDSYQAGGIVELILKCTM